MLGAAEGGRLNVYNGPVTRRRRLPPIRRRTRVAVTASRGSKVVAKCGPQCVLGGHTRRMPCRSAGRPLIGRSELHHQRHVRADRGEISESLYWRPDRTHRGTQGFAADRNRTSPRDGDRRGASVPGPSAPRLDTAGLNSPRGRWVQLEGGQKFGDESPGSSPQSCVLPSRRR